jgi:hypothetical protein
MLAGVFRLSIRVFSVDPRTEHVLLTPGVSEVVPDTLFVVREA